VNLDAFFSEQRSCVTFLCSLQKGEQVPSPWASGCPLTNTQMPRTSPQPTATYVEVLAIVVKALFALVFLQSFCHI